MNAPGPAYRRGIGGSVWWRQLRIDVWADVAIAAVVAVTVFVVAAAPRLLEHASSMDLEETIATATPEQRNLRFHTRGEIGAGPVSDPFLNIDLRGEQLRDEHIPDSVSALLRGEQWVVDSPEFVVSSFPDEEQGPFPTTFRFRYQQGIEERSRLVAGRAPEQQDPIFQLEGPQCPDDVDPAEFRPVPDLECVRVAVPLFEATVTQQTADDMMVEIGDLVTLRPSVTDLAFRTIRVDPSGLRLFLRISGIVELDDPALEYWYADSSLHRPRITENPDFRLVFAMGLFSPDQYRLFRTAAPGAGMNFSWRYLVDPDLVERADAEQVRDDVSRIAPPDVEFATQLPELLGTHLAQRRLATVLLSLAAVGIAVSALAAIWVLTAVDGVRRRPVTSLLVDRGASRWQMRLHAGRTALAVAVPAAAVAVAAAWALLPDTRWRPTWLPVAAVVLSVVVSVVAAGTPAPPALDRERRRLRRVVVDVLVLVGAAAAVVLLRRRESSVADADGGGFDPLLAVAPALVAVAAGLVLLRVVGPAASVLARLAARRRTIGFFVGTRRLADQPAELRTPIAALTIAAAAAVFATVVSVSLDRGRELASWQAVGAEARVETGNPGIPLPEALRDVLVAQSEQRAFGASLPVQRFDGPGGSYVADVLAIDLADYLALIDPSIVADLVDAPLDQLSGTTDGALNAILVGAGTGGSTPRAGDTIQLENGAFVVPMAIVGTSDGFPGLADGRATVLVDRSALLELTDRRTVEPTFVLLDGDAALGERTRALLDDPRVLARTTVRSDRLEAIAGDPLSRWTSRSVWLFGATALVLAMVTVAASTIITATARRRDLGVLAVLGSERRATAGLVAIELLPGVVGAAIGGAAAGAWAARVLGPNLSLGSFGGSDDAATVLSWPVVLGVAAGLILVTAVTVMAMARSIRRVDHAMLLRKGDL